MVVSFSTLSCGFVSALLLKFESLVLEKELC